MEYYKINTSYANYYIMIKPYFDGKEHYMDKVFLGSKKKCMVISIHFDSDELIMFLSIMIDLYSEIGWIDM